MRTGARSAAKSAAFGGVLLAMIEGVGILLTRMTAPPPAPVPMVDMPGPSRPVSAAPEINATASMSAIPEPIVVEAAPASSSSGGWSSWFGGGKKEEADKGKPQDLTEERFAPPPMPDFSSQEPQFCRSSLS